MKLKGKSAKDTGLEEKIKSIEKRERAIADKDKDYKEYHFRIFTTAFLCLAIAAAGIILTLTVFRDRDENASGVSAVTTYAATSAVHSVDSFSTDPIYNSDPYDQIIAEDNGDHIVTAPPVITTAATIPESSTGSDEISQNEPETQRDEQTVRPASSTAVSITERGYNGNVLFG